MDLIKKSLKKRLLALILVMLGIYGIFAAILIAAAHNETNSDTPVEYLLIFFGAFILFTILLVFIILLFQASKSKKRMQSLNAKELEQLKQLIANKETVCGCYFLDQHLVSFKALMWTIIPYANIRSIKRECTVYKSYGIPVSKQYNIIVTVKEGKPLVYNLLVKKKVLNEEYAAFAGKIAEINPNIYEAGIMGKYR